MSAGADAIKALALALDAMKLRAGEEIAYAENPAASVGAGTTEAGAAVLVTFPPVAFDGATPVIAELMVAEVNTSAVLGVVGWIYLFSSATSLGIAGVVRGPSAHASAVGVPVRVQRRFTPPAGTWTYSWRLSQSGGAVSAIGGAGGSGNRFPIAGRLLRA